jgi:predicted PurR-regulated permease PerM
MKMPKFEASPRMIQNLVFGVILVALFLLVCRLFAPFFTVLLWSVILFVILNPLHQQICKKIDFSTKRGKVLKNILAGVFSLGTAMLVLVPVLFVLSQILRQIMELIRIIRDVFIEKPTMLQDILANISGFISDISSGQIDVTPEEIQRRFLTVLNSGLNNLLFFSKGIALNISSFLLSIIFMVFCLFFFYLDGAFLSNLFLNIIPIKKEYISALVTKFKDITKNLFLGYIIVALIQAVLSYIVFTIFDVKGALVFSCLTFICVFIPMIGGSIVWLPLGIAKIVAGNVVGGVVFLVVSAVCISLFDNILRPFFLQNRIQLHPLIIFFAIMGGISEFGFNGLVLGPMIVIIFLTVLDMFLTEHQIEHGKTKYTGGDEHE